MRSVLSSNVSRCAVAIALAGLVPAGSATLEACSTHGVVDGFVRPAGAGRFELRLTGFVTVDYPLRHRCGCGLAAGGIIAGVPSARLVASGTDARIPGLGPFAPERTVTATLEEESALGGLEWFGFAGTADGVAGGVPLDIVFELEVARDATLADVVAALAENRVATGEVSADGSEFVSHFSSTRAAIRGAAPGVPGAGTRGLAMLAVLLAASGMAALARRASAGPLTEKT